MHVYAACSMLYATCEKVFLCMGMGVKDIVLILLVSELLDQFSLGHTEDGVVGAIDF